MTADKGRLDTTHTCIGGACRQAPLPVSLDDVDLVAYWRFDEGTGFTVHDVTCATPAICLLRMLFGWQILACAAKTERHMHAEQAAMCGASAFAGSCGRSQWPGSVIHSYIEFLWTGRST